MMTGPTGRERWSLAAASRWVDAQGSPTRSEIIRADRLAVGRVLAEEIRVTGDRPGRDGAITDGYALRAADTIGAGGYNPLYLSLVPRGQPLSAGEASLRNAGESLPEGADAVLPADAGEIHGTILEIGLAVASGQGVARKGQTARPGDRALGRGRRLSAADIALTALLGEADLRVFARPKIALLIAGAKPPAEDALAEDTLAKDALAEALVALTTRDGGVAALPPSGQGMAEALAAGRDADLLVVVGRSGWGDDDRSVRDIQQAGGVLEQHGLAFTLGPTTGFGRLGRVPLLLLPGDPLAALITFELLAGRMIRGLSGLPAAMPYPLRRMPLTRKIASPIGTAEWVPLRCRDGRAEPLPLSPADGLIRLARADAFLIVPPEREGYPDGAMVDVYVTATVIPGEEER